MPARTLRVVLVAVAVVLAVVVVAVLSSHAPSPRTDRHAAARRRLAAALTRDLERNPTVPGEAVAVRAPGLDVTAAAGLADVEGGRPLHAETPFRIASVTKTFVAVAVLRLVEQHRVRLDAPVTAYLAPETIAMLRGGGYRPEEITVRQLLDHTSGLFDYAATKAYDDVNVADPGHRWTRAEQVRFAMEHGRPRAAPGRKYHYADTGYVLLGELLERATRRPLPSAVRDLVGFRRLGLDHTYWESLEPAPAGAPPLAHQYYGDEFDNATLDASHDLYGGGGLVSTVADVTRFYRALFHGRILDEHTLRTMVEPSRAGRAAGAGMGIFRIDVDGRECFSHAGYWGTEAVHCPALDLTYTRTTNQADDSELVSGPLERVVAGLAAQGGRAEG
jgi:D-alanyl-D-alanine carboxypeptidase